MKRDWKQERAKSAKHSRLMVKRPELREALYGLGPSSAGYFKLKNREGRPPELDGPATRETAHKEQNDG
jgi:hypothetical protein